MQVIDHDGSLVPCNGEKEFSDFQRSVFCWLALDLLIGSEAEEEVLRSFLNAVGRCGPGIERQFPVQTLSSGFIGLDSEKFYLYVNSFKNEYDQMLGYTNAYQPEKIFVQSAERFTLYKICRWAACVGTENHDRSRSILANIRYEFDLQRDHRCLLISSAIDRRTNQIVMQCPERSVHPTIALAMKVLHADRSFSDVERITLHRTMLHLGVQPTEVNGLGDLFKCTVGQLVQKIDPADHEEALRVILEMAILDHVITPTERIIIDETLTYMNLSKERLDRIRLKAELDTGAQLGFEKGFAIDYSSFKDPKRKAG